MPHENNPISVEDVSLSSFHRRLTIRSGGGWVMDGYILSIIGVALIQLSTELELTSFWQGMIAASALRRSLVIHSFLWSGLALLGLGYYSTGAEWLVLVLFGAYAVFIGGAQVLQLVYPNEIFPTEIRAFAVGMGASLSRIGAAVGTWLVPISLDTIGIGNTMYAAAGVSLVGLLVSIALAPETRSLNLQEAASLTR